MPRVSNINLKNAEVIEFNFKKNYPFPKLSFHSKIHVTTKIELLEGSSNPEANVYIETKLICTIPELNESEFFRANMTIVGFFSSDDISFEKEDFIEKVKEKALPTLMPIIRANFLCLLNCMGNMPSNIFPLFEYDDIRKEE